MDQQPTNQEILDAINAHVTHNDAQMTEHGQTLKKHGEMLEKHDQRLDRQESTLDRLNLAIVQMQEDNRLTRERMTRLEELTDRTYRRIDDFLHKMDVHEAEIYANRSAYQRLEQRVSMLEEKVAA
ncbi:MAG: hypothetical protein UY76_C0065G0002 [Candidatus Uhrbacteria bacterium GW2011_GWA2_52_8d]|uniref:Uncharacterized protein n=1 Tax=Candidatus Uhrbacteria bacterium GW2011_GWA2_52_8d TaxID=1618979 RepID=A0A0G2AF66_9BACT|nr:MAG: hypothetical protein UY76_C0065G0002 [Candidatus Uhrbacteria bacterium GW2011_GWA2_52_8d]